jgi:hypothetical protein
MGLFDLGTEMVIVKTFQDDLNGFKKAPLAVQVQAGKEIFEDIQMLSQLNRENLNKVIPQLREKYKSQRHIAIGNGATNELDPDYAYAAIMESVILAIGRDKIAEKVMTEVITWLQSIGVIKKP